LEKGENFTRKPFKIFRLWSSPHEDMFLIYGNKAMNKPRPTSEDLQREFQFNLKVGRNQNLILWGMEIS
jgi:hypothetical protein